MDTLKIDPSPSLPINYQYILKKPTTTPSSLVDYKISCLKNITTSSLSRDYKIDILKILACEFFLKPPLSAICKSIGL